MDKNLVYLVQTDTTVGFLSNNYHKLSHIKQRPFSQKILQVVPSFALLQRFTRVPSRYKNMIRRSKKTTFIYPNLSAFRVVNKASNHYKFLKRFEKLYSTSANITNQDFDETYAKEVVDVIVVNKNGFSEQNPSKIYKIDRNKLIKIR